MAPPVKHKKVSVSIDDIGSVYYSSKTMTQASVVLSKKYGLTSRAWRYRLKGFEMKGQLSRSGLLVAKPHRARMKVKRPAALPSEVMLTVHFKIKYEKIGGRGFHPFHLEGFYSRRVVRGFGQSDINDMMQFVSEKLSEYGALTNYLKVNNQEYEHGVEVEEISETHKRDNEFHAEKIKR